MRYGILMGVEVEFRAEQVDGGTQRFGGRGTIDELRMQLRAQLEQQEQPEPLPA